MTDAAARLIPIEDFFRKPERAAVRISPDGAYLSWMAPYERRLNLHVQVVATGEVRRVTSATARDLGGYTWVGPERLLFVQDAGGDENTRLFSVGVDGADPLDLTPYEDVKCSLVDDLEETPDEVLFEMNKRDREVFDVYRLNVVTGEMASIAENPGNVESWMTDHEGRLRVAMTTDGVNHSLLYRDDEDSAWRTLATHDFKESLTPVAFTFDNARLYVTSNVGRDKSAVCIFDPASGEEVEELFSHPDVDLDQLLFSKHRKLVTGVAFHTDKPGYQFVDDARRELQECAEKAIPGAHVALVSHTRDESSWIVHAGGDQTPGAYWLLDANAGSVTHLFDVKPWLEAATACPMQPISYMSRDGLTIHGYLTLPQGIAIDGSSGQVPLVVNPHGGPWIRDGWGYNPEVQLLASRGMAVLQMNYRGSTGYGRAFWEASFQQWGRTMQDDVSDGVTWACEQGFADSRRVAIYGASYGGYAALAGMTFTPELYACGISYVGVSNLFTLIASMPPYWKPFLEMFHEMVGHPERDEVNMRAISPVFHADKIRAPLLVIQGANDPRVKKAESDQIVEAVRAHGFEVDYLVKDNEGHGFHNEENQFEAYHRIVDFLTKHLSAGSQSE